MRRKRFAIPLYEDLMETFKPFSQKEKFPLSLAPALVALVQFFVLITLPYFALFQFTKSEFVFVVLISTIGLTFLSFSVFSVSVSEEGIRLKRLLGSPKLITWQDFKGISRASPREVIIYGWLWPLFPAREMSLSMNVSGHVRIFYRDKYLFFPPESFEEFQNAIEKYRAKAFSHGAQKPLVRR